MCRLRVFPIQCNYLYNNDSRIGKYELAHACTHTCSTFYYNGSHDPAVYISYGHCYWGWLDLNGQIIDHRKQCMHACVVHLLFSIFIFFSSGCCYLLIINASMCCFFRILIRSDVRNVNCSGTKWWQIEYWFLAASPNILHILIISRMNGWLSANAHKLLQSAVATAAVAASGGSDGDSKIRMQLYCVDCTHNNNNRSNLVDKVEMRVRESIENEFNESDFCPMNKNHWHPI